jgi:hypothetical protein
MHKHTRTQGTPHITDPSGLAVRKWDRPMHGRRAFGELCVVTHTRGEEITRLFAVRMLVRARRVPAPGYVATAVDTPAASQTAVDRSQQVGWLSAPRET